MAPPRIPGLATFSMRLAVDFNSYFASVEQQLDPALRGRPVGVVPMMADTTCCIAASYEAKKCGVKTGTLVREARRLCPEIRFIVGDHAKYVEFHHRAIAAIDEVCQVVDVPSIDEMHCELNARDAAPERAKAIARRIKENLYAKVGEYLKCSIGIAPNAYLAKTASDMQKPDGLIVIEAQDLPQVLFRLDLRDFCGIGPRMERRLRAHGLHTAEQLCTASKERLREAWGGVEGEIMWRRLRGEAVWTPPSGQRSIGHSHVLPPAMRNDADAHAVIHRMLQKTAMRLRKQGFVCASMHIHIGHAGEDRGWGKDGRFSQTQDTGALTRYLDRLWDARPRGAHVPLSVGVVLGNLAPAAQQTLPLFADSPVRPALNGAIDRINLRFGKSALYFGHSHGAQDHAPMRVAFTRIPDLDTER